MPPKCLIALKKFYFLVVLITGGYELGNIESEIYDPLTKTSCMLPNITYNRAGHTQDGLLLCGGGDGLSADDKTTLTCLTWSQGTWNVSHHLIFRRMNQVSWTPASGAGTYLMGGVFIEDVPSPRQKTEIVRPDGTVEQGFDLAARIK